jgi:hypothetical protein
MDQVHTILQDAGDATARPSPTVAGPSPRRSGPGDVRTATRRFDTMVSQEALTVVVPIEAGRLQELETQLRTIQQEITDGKMRASEHATIPFGELSTVHFARWVILPGTTLRAGTRRERVIPASLAFSTNYDGPLAVHLAELVMVAGTGLDQIYRHCTGYPSLGSRALASVIAFLRAHMVPAAAFHSGHHRLSLQQIRAGVSLRKRIRAHLESRPGDRPGSGPEARQLIQDGVRQDRTLAWAMKPPPRPRAWRRALDAVARMLILSLGLIIVHAVTRIAGLLVWPYELRENAADRTIDESGRRPQVVSADRASQQSELTHLVPLKPSRLRRYVLKGFLWTLNRIARYGFTQGDLMGVRSIHFAHWALIDGDARLLFISNYDGSWDGYLTDFIQVERAANGMNAIWSHTEKFPRTRRLIGEGVRDVVAFKKWARFYQLSAQVWYQPYPDLSVQNVHNDAAIWAGLWGHLSTKKLNTWLNRLPSIKGE